jgi:hypothetical protein
MIIDFLGSIQTHTISLIEISYGNGVFGKIIWEIPLKNAGKWGALKRSPAHNPWTFSVIPVSNLQ